MARDAQERALRDAQRRGGGLPRRPRDRHDAAPGHHQGGRFDRAHAAARCAQRRIPRVSETVARLFHPTGGGMKRRDFLGAAVTAPLLGGLLRPAFAQSAVVRQGYQTNMWGMPTYYLLRSGALEKNGIRYEEFAVPSGNITMQQMVGRQVDLGTYAGPSFILGHARGGLVAIAQIEEVGRTVRIMARKELGITKVSELRGRKIANQSGSSIAQVFTDTIAPKAGLRKEDWQEVRMNVNDMVAAMAAKTVDAMINVEPYNSIAEADGIA